MLNTTRKHTIIEPKEGNNLAESKTSGNSKDFLRSPVQAKNSYGLNNDRLEKAISVLFADETEGGGF